MTIDLHTHSTASDGLFSPTDLLERARQAGIKTLALTDHDTTEGLAEAAQEAHRFQIDFIPGIELNTDTGHGEVHVLGYYLDYQRPAFQQVLTTLRDTRVRRGQKIVENLNAQGVNISWERVRELAQGSVGRPHIAEALKEAGYVQSVSEAFEKFIGNGSPAYVPRYKLSPVDAVRLIVSVNGLAVVAHPLHIPGLEILNEWLPQLCEAGLTGLETYYGPYTSQEEMEILTLANRYHLVPTGGSDYHGPNMHPTPLGGHAVPQESVNRLKALSAQRQGQTPPIFYLPPPEKEK